MPQRGICATIRLSSFAFDPTMTHTADQSPLGKTSAYRTDYAPELLFPIPRQGKRDELGLTGTMPFFGVDIWNAYELSWLNMRGKPQVAVAKIEIVQAVFEFL
jgi:7-cyano-7-deazaguanine reductase